MDYTPVGLINTEGTCYMNATLQCLYNIRELTNYLLELKVGKNTILSEYINVLSGLKNNTTPYDASNFRKKMEKINKLFKSYKGHDPSDLIIFLFNGLQNELSPYPKIKLWFYETIIYNEELREIYDDIGKTKINDLFNCITIQTLKCRCKNPTYIYQTQQMIVLNINTDDSLNNFLENFKKPYLSHSTCNICKGQYLISKDIKIYPKYMIFVLNSINKHIKYQVRYNEYIYLNEDNINIAYSLFGGIIHKGSNSNSGHFVSYCRNIQNNNYYYFNDSSVQLTDFERVKNESPYILFYQRSQGQYQYENQDNENFLNYAYKKNKDIIFFNFSYESMKISGIINSKAKEVVINPLDVEDISRIHKLENIIMKIIANLNQISDESMKKIYLVIKKSI